MMLIRKELIGTVPFLAECRERFDHYETYLRCDCGRRGFQRQHSRVEAHTINCFKQ